MPVLKAEGKTFPTNTEVLIIGAGACGTIAALAAKERGAEVVILERDAKPSGSTSLSSGQIPAAGTKLQRAAGLLDDTPELLYQDILAKAHGECDHAIARLIAEESRNTVEWLVERHQVPLSCVLNFQYPGHSRPHMHAAKSLDGAELHAALLAAVERHEIPLATSAHATDLYADADGRVRGVRVTRPDGKTEDIGCEALILACNGYGGNKEMLKKYIPDAADLFYEGHVGNQGDAVRWGEALGASIKDMGSFQGHGAMATPHGVHLNWATVTEGGFHVNVQRQALLERERRLLRAGAEGPSPARRRGLGDLGRALRRHRHAAGEPQGGERRGRHQALRLRRGHRARRRLRSEGAGADLRRRRRRGTRRKAGPVRPRLQGQAAAQAAVLRFEDRGRAHAHPGRAGGEHARCACCARTARRCPNLFAGGGAARGLSGPSDWGYLSGSGLMTATSMGRLAGISAAKLVKE